MRSWELLHKVDRPVGHFRRLAGEPLVGHTCILVQLPCCHGYPEPVLHDLGRLPVKANSHSAVDAACLGSDECTQAAWLDSASVCTSHSGKQHSIRVLEPSSLARACAPTVRTGPQYNRPQREGSFPFWFQSPPPLLTCVHLHGQNRSTEQYYCVLIALIFFILFSVSLPFCL